MGFTEDEIVQNSFEYSRDVKEGDSKSSMVPLSTWVASDTSKPHAKPNKPKSEDNQTNQQRVTANREAQNARFAALDHNNKKKNSQ
jgi:hypothetical protein